MLTTIQRATCATRRFYCINANPFFREVLEIAPDKNVVSGQGEKVFDVVLGMIFRMSKGASFSFSESFSLRCFHRAMFAFIFHFYANVQLFMLAFFFTIHVQLRVPVSKFSCSAPFSSPFSMHLRRLSLTIYFACCSHRRSNSGTKRGLRFLLSRFFRRHGKLGPSWSGGIVRGPSFQVAGDEKYTNGRRSWIGSLIVTFVSM